MREAEEPIAYLKSLDLPSQDLSRLKFCGGSRLSHLERWLGNLQATRITHTSAQLYQNLPELNRLKTNVQTRLAMLDATRPLVQTCISGLAPDFVGQPLAGPAQKTAVLAQALQKILIDGYSLCIRDLLKQRRLNAASRILLATAMARALFSIGRLYLRTCQIYTQMPGDFWLQAHNIYQVATHLGLARTSVADPLLQWQSEHHIRDAYLQPTILACSQPNQLNPKDMETLYLEAEKWTAGVRLRSHPPADSALPFIIDLSRDAAPIHKRQFDGSQEDYLLEPDFQNLRAALQNRQVSPAMPPHLVAHLTNAWSQTSGRDEHRHPIRTAADICLGLTDCHYYLSDKQPFAAFIASTPEGSQALESAAPGEQHAKGQHPRARSAPLTQHITVLNVSAGGYCLQWPGAMPENAVAGQLLGIREAGEAHWQLGVARWVRQLRGQSQVGVQVLGIGATPAAASIAHQSGGHSSPMRVLQLGPDAEGNPATLITAAIPFQETNRVRLETRDQTLYVSLERCLFSTSHMRRFSYRLVDSERALAADEAGSSAF